ncbi:S-adenosyl-L-methionine-dependent methyltransferase [Dentipellis sp. KUC8613]|nr:S-adenosyl-L-methionine-dependent methyltransferase [Dentipellis sp. KUC8613]
MSLSLLRASSTAARSSCSLHRHARSLPRRWYTSGDSSQPGPVPTFEEPVVVKRRGRPPRAPGDAKKPRSRSKKIKVVDEGSAAPRFDASQPLNNASTREATLSASSDHTERSPAQDVPVSVRPDHTYVRSAAYAALPPLPPLDEWRTYFQTTPSGVRDRISIRNPESATQVARGFLTGKRTRTNQPKIVIEAFPGPGALSRALMTLPPDQMSKLIILEDWPPYLEYLKPLEKVDPRVKVVQYSGFVWDTYRHLEEAGLFEDVETVPWDENIHPRLHFITHIPQNIAGEQLVAQLFRNIPENSWLFKYGRIPMSFLMSDWVWRRVSAPATNSERCKLSVIAEATAGFGLAVPPEALLPFDDHFHPTRIGPKATVSPSRRPENRRLGSPFVAVNTVPRESQVISRGKLDMWDYVLRRLFVLKSTPLKNAMSSLAPGAQVLLKHITDPALPPEKRVDISAQVRHLTVQEWDTLVRAFEVWPFAPSDLSIDSFQALEER